MLNEFYYGLYILNDTKIIIFVSKLTGKEGSPINIELMEGKSNIVDRRSSIASSFGQP